MTRTEKFIQDNKRALTCGRDYFNPDTSFMPVEQFEKSKLKVLVCFPSPSSVKAVSTTKEALNDYVIEHCPDVFIDFCFIPDASDIKLFDKHAIPYAVGLITHLDASHFDVVGMSISVLSEVITMASVINSFQRCDKPIPLTWTERKDMRLGEVPIIFAGGITAACGDIMYGELGDGRQAFSDFTYLGECGKLGVVFNRLIEARETGKVTRSKEDRFTYGYADDPDEDKYESLIEDVVTNQDYIDTLFDLRCIYQPQAYEVKFNDKTQIISNIKINPKAQDWVKPYYPHKMNEDLGIGRAIINASGENCGTTQTQVSDGCSAGGACSFAVVKGTRLWTSKGLVKIEDYEGSNMRLDNDGLEYVSVQKVQSEKPWVFVTAQGHELKASPSHKFFIVKGGELVQVRGSELQEGDIILRKIGRSIDPVSFIEPDFAELLGFMHGDGCFDKINSRWKIYMSDLELPHYEPLFRKYVTTGYKTRVHYTGSKGNIWVIEGNAPSFEYDIADVVCSELYVPECIMQGSDEVVRRYLKGIFQADGWYNRVLGLTTISKNYIQDIALLLSTQGIDSTIRVNEYFDRNPLEGHKVSYYLQVPKEFHAKFEQIIGSVSKHITDFTISNRAKGWLKSDICFREEIRGDREYLRSNGMSDFLSGPRNYIADYKWRTLGVKQSMKEAQRLVASGQYVTDVVVAISECDEVEDMYDVVLTSNHHCVYGDWLTHNCAEGNYTGGWCEKPKEQILHEIREAKKYSAGYKYKPFSFNCNYLTDYKGMLYEFIQRYPKVTFINMRMEELGRDVDAIKMMKLIGSNRISAPMEGISPRIQNVLLNKCLSEESLNAFMDDMVHAKMGDIKVGGIFTAFEEDEDFQWICDFVDKFKKRAKQEGGNFPFRLKMCATDDVLTPVPGRGLLRQSALVEGPVLGYEYADIIATKEQGMSEVYEIVTNFGVSIKVTPNHPVLTEYHGHGVKESYYTKAIDLTPGQSVYGRIGTEVYGTNSSVLGHRLTEHLAAVLGWYMGDGYANVHDNYKTHGHCFADTETDIMDHIAKWYVDNGYNPRTHDMGSKKAKAFRIHNTVLTRALVREFGHTAYGKKISDKILQAPKNIQAEFLAYWFAADGTVTTDNRGNYNSRIRLYSVNREVLKDAQAMLFNMGIIAILSGHKTKCGEKNFYTYQLEIKSCSVPKFVDTIKIPGRKGKLVQVRNTRGSHCLKANGIIKMTVKSVKRVPDEETYGIEVTNHSYLTNGILSHNTPLVHYNLTPCEYLPRLSAKKSMMGEHWLTDEWYEKFREHNVFFKVNGFRYSTFLEQSIIDLGRKATHIVYEQILKKGVEVYSLRSIAKPEIIQAFKDEINPDYFFNVRDPEHYISLSHRIHIDLMGSYIPRARRLVRNYINGNVFEGHEDVRCLKTFDGAKTMCYSKCAVKDPLKIYNDVTMDEEGNLHGEYRLLIGCERCQSTELKLARLKRPTPFTKNSDDILAAPRMKKVQRLRFVINRNKEYDVLNPNNTAHTFIAKFLQKSEKLTDWYHSMNIHSMAWQAEPELPYVCEGIQIVDTIWTSAGAYDEVSRLISEVNSDMKSVQILSCREVLMNDKLDCDDYNVFRFETKLPYDLFATSLPSYKGEIKIQGDFEAVIKKDKNCRPPVFIQVGKVVGYFALPMKYNPVFYMQQFLNAKKLPGSKIMQEIDFKCVMAVSENSRVICKNCNSEIATISLSSGKNFPFGVNCLLKALLSKEMKS